MVNGVNSQKYKEYSSFDQADNEIDGDARDERCEQPTPSPTSSPIPIPSNDPTPNPTGNIIQHENQHKLLHFVQLIFQHHDLLIYVHQVIHPKQQINLRHTYGGSYTSTFTTCHWISNTKTYSKTHCTFLVIRL